MRCQFSSGPKLLLSGPMPALFISTSVPPNRFCTEASSAATSSKRLTSTVAVMTSAAPPLATDASVAAASASRSAPISAMHTFMPRPAKCVAAASPMPEAPPVMTAILPGDMAGWGMRYFLDSLGGDLGASIYRIFSLRYQPGRFFPRPISLRSATSSLRAALAAARSILR